MAIKLDVAEKALHFEKVLKESELQTGFRWDN